VARRAGLGLFSASGTQLALAQDLPGIVAVLMGVITATFGGVLRDIVCNEIPTALRDHRPYAICAFAGGWVLVLAQQLGVPPGLALLLGGHGATGLRVLALVTGYTLPRWSSGSDRLPELHDDVVGGPLRRHAVERHLTSVHLCQRHGIERNDEGPLVAGGGRQVAVTRADRLGRACSTGGEAGGEQRQAQRFNPHRPTSRAGCWTSGRW
jgi:hypothetical protein